jgi:hypothetical protein
MSGWIRGVWGAIKGTKPQVKKTGTKEVIEHFKKAVKGLEPQQKASIYKTHVAPYVKKWSGKKGDKPSKKKD